MSESTAFRTWLRSTSSWPWISRSRIPAMRRHGTPGCARRNPALRRFVVSAGGLLSFFAPFSETAPPRSVLNLDTQSKTPSLAAHADACDAGDREAGGDGDPAGPGESECQGFTSGRAERRFSSV